MEKCTELLPRKIADKQTLYDHAYKVIIVGDPGTGKSHITSRFTQNDFPEHLPPTVIMEYTRKILLKPLTGVQIFDLAGRDIFRTVTTGYYKGAVGAIVVYDITKVRSFENTEGWIDHIRKTLGSEDPVILLLGNKLDLRHHRSVTIGEGQTFARSKNTLFLEVSAKDATNVRKAFEILIEHVKLKAAQAELKRDVNLGAGLERGAKSLTQTVQTRKSTFGVVQAQPKPSYSLRNSMRSCLDGAKGSCCIPFTCCLWGDK